MGIGTLVAVPIFKSVTHLPPFMGILFGLGILWLVGEMLHRKKLDEFKEHLTLVAALKRIDMSCIIFFVGILLAVATLEHSHILAALAQWLNHTVGRMDIIVTLIGLASAVVDNVPLVAASMGMYEYGDLSHRQFPLGVHGLLCRNRRFYPHHWLSCGCCRHGFGKDTFFLVREKNRGIGCIGLFLRNFHIYSTVQIATQLIRSKCPR